MDLNKNDFNKEVMADKFELKEMEMLINEWKDRIRTRSKSV